ncbi:DnaJ subfamily A member 3, mitochondrial [Cichlidogyrus casuarinus]|uniref:DnaJ subfamily A member 3, mitochondrial n=1 Tax=Cichlidogyrus casuarinus TaxID=1844966 RepID=A0ABD2QGQ9_9PLAT
MTNILLFTVFHATGNNLQIVHHPIRKFQTTNWLSKDFYKVLGINKGASASEIKKAYYQLAKKYHPDVNKNDKSAAQKFQEVSEAYEVLGDESKRSQYDSFGATSGPGTGTGTGRQGFGGFQDFSNFSHINPEELFRRIFKDSEFAFREWSSGDRGFAESVFGFNATREVTINLTFLESARGCNKEVDVNMVTKCIRCEGTRCQPGTGTTTCPQCRGTGHETIHTGPLLMSTTCRRCQGAGHIVRHPCTECEGTGHQIVRHKVKISIPAGVENGQVLRTSVSGPNAVPQELFVNIRVQSNSQFKREGPDIHSDVHISLAQAALGGKIRVPGVYEQMLINIPPGTNSHDIIRLPGKGISRLNSHGYGDHYVHVRIKNKRSLSELQKALLLAYAETEADVNGSVNGVVSTETGLDRLRRMLAVETSPSRKEPEHDFSDAKSVPEQEVIQSEGTLSDLAGFAGKHAIDNTKGYLLSRIKAACKEQEPQLIDHTDAEENKKIKPDKNTAASK